MTDPFNLPESAEERLAREFRDSPAERLRREYESSPAIQLALSGAAAGAAKDIANMKAADPALLLAGFDQMTVAAKGAKALAEFKPVTIDPDLMKWLTAARPLNLDQTILDGLGGYKPMGIAPNLASAIAEAQRALADLGKPHGGLSEAVRAIEKQQRSFQTALMATLGGAVGDAVRVNQWATALAAVDVPDIAKLYAGAPNISAEITQLHEEAVRASAVGLAGYNQAELSALLGLNHRFDAVLEATSLKMSAFAGVTDLTGIQSPAWQEAYHSLFGEWRSRPDLPSAYWRDPRARRRMYDAAEVDPGLAGAGLGVAVEVMIESGLTSGVRSEANAVAVIRVGHVSMTIRSRGTRNDAFALLGRFEEELRAFITRKLADRFGDDWFKLRVDGNTAGNAKQTRVQALRRGEQSFPLIHYTDLGDLSNILRSKKNWEELFEAVFINASELDHDMQKLIAARRPTMHTRPIDGLRLVEMVCVIERISRQMADDGTWKQRAESDE
ncbi:MAG: Swt1 family HEPN domain-containing protein [Sphingomicrobium sp.]